MLNSKNKEEVILWERPRCPSRLGPGNLTGDEGMKNGQTHVQKSWHQGEHVTWMDLRQLLITWNLPCIVYYAQKEPSWSEGSSLKALQSSGRRKLQLLIFAYTQSIIPKDAHLDQRKAFVMPLSLTQTKALPVPLGLRHRFLSKVHIYSGRHSLLTHSLKAFLAPHRRQIILEGQRNSNMLNN